MPTKIIDMEPPKKMQQAAKIMETVCQELEIDTLSIYVKGGRLFGIGTFGNSYFVDSENGRLKLQVYVEYDA